MNSSMGYGHIVYWSDDLNVAGNMTSLVKKEGREWCSITRSGSSTTPGGFNLTERTQGQLYERCEEKFYGVPSYEANSRTLAAGDSRTDDPVTRLEDISVKKTSCALV